MARLNYIVTVISITLMYVVAQELYSDKYDDIDVMSILENEQIFNKIYGCFMDTFPCETEAGKFFKGIFPEAVQTNCKKCTEKQKNNLNLAADWMTKNKPNEWQALVAKSVEEMKMKNVGQ
ncbi:ejaculatory bulb-specific protein 3 [Monomorium pharaonis]|uniref:ejaculatory bulb-specific protein 3 n=1 Tax=Monomorium pharaonis TaxID=307658 RepID=UPI0017460D60|nr:ejaculatory bulb-specific protein 3 [Monomorium pharaonis]